ncbi:hypothetical protein R1flu_025937 [Riccia fluitans]|uniref:Peptidase A1 domain-containing protein n=1 Tax=Riccia fluitans TaxID=41844 RepID=A0ABD1XZK1_9MARC
MGTSRATLEPMIQGILIIAFFLSVEGMCDEGGPSFKESQSSDAVRTSCLPTEPLKTLASAQQDCYRQGEAVRTLKSGVDGRTVIARRLGEGVGYAGGKGIRLSMTQRKIYSREPLQHLVSRDQKRVRRFARHTESSSAVATYASLRAEERATFPDITNPGGKKKAHNTTYNSTSGVNNLFNFQSTVGSGVHLGSGEYFMDFYVGTPARLFSVIVDTGSDLTWVQCDPCKLCYPQEGDYFNPNASSSYYGLRCNSTSCRSAGGFGEDSHGDGGCNPQMPGDCKYFYNYGDLSNTTGDYALETVTFNVSGGAPLQIEQILFGCGHSNIGLFQGSGGLLGLGQGAISFVSQIGNLFGNKFSYCLVPRDHPLGVKSPLVFGEDSAYASLENKMQWTPILKNTPVDTFYYINITGVSVAGETLPISEDVWIIDSQGYGGSIIDSGTTLTYFKPEAYDLISKRIQELISYPIVSSIPVLDICYNVSDVMNPDFPSLSITFQDNAIMELPFKNYFIRADPEDEVYCLALLPGGPKNMNIIGNFQQQNFHVVYDRGNARVGFAHVDCSSLL